MPEAPVPPAPYFTVNFADDDGKPTDRKMALRTFQTRDEAQKFVDERRRALEELNWSPIIVEHKPTESIEG